MGHEIGLHYDSNSQLKKVTSNQDFFRESIEHEAKKLESIIHPKEEQVKKKFLSFHKKKKTKLVILEIPILFETKGHKNCNYTILVYVNKKEQFKRVLARKKR